MRVCSTTSDTSLLNTKHPLDRLSSK